MKVNDILVVDGVINFRFFIYFKYVVLKIKDVIVDQFCEVIGCCFNVNVYVFWFRVNVYIFNDECIIVLDSFDDFLYK